MPAPTLAPPGHRPGIRSNPSAAHLPASMKEQGTDTCRSSRLFPVSNRPAPAESDKNSHTGNLLQKKALIFRLAARIRSASFAPMRLTPQGSHSPTHSLTASGRSFTFRRATSSNLHAGTGC